MRRRIIRQERQALENRTYFPLGDYLITPEQQTREREEVLRRGFSSGRIRRRIARPQRLLSDEEREIEDEKFVRQLVSRYA